MIVQINVSSDMVDQLKVFTDQNTASKAFMHAAAWHAVNERRILDLESQLDSSYEQIKALKQTIESARSAASQLLEVAGQGDLL